MKKIIGLFLMLGLVAGLLSSCQTVTTTTAAGKAPATGSSGGHSPATSGSVAQSTTAPASGGTENTQSAQSGTSSSNPVAGEDVFLLLFFIGLSLGAIVSDTIGENRRNQEAGRQTPADGGAAPASDTMKFVKKIAGALNTMETFNAWHAENRRALYHDAGEWARHYSTVRLTVATIVITMCAAIIALKPERLEADDDLGNAICLLWLAGLFVFYTFTYLTYKQRNRQLGHRRFMPIDADDGPEKERAAAQIAQDAAAYALLFLNCLFVYLFITHGPQLQMWPGWHWAILLACSVIVLFLAFADCWIFKKITARRIGGIILTVCVLIGANYWLMMDWMQ